jgi:nitroreductase
MNTLKTVPDGKTGKKLKVVSAITLAGEGEASRRSLCKREFQMFKERALSLASADAGEYPQAKRQLIPQLKIAGADRGLNAKIFANLGEGASTLSIIEQLDTQWNVLSLCVSPDTRSLDSIVAAELATIQELRTLSADAGATLRVLPDVEASLAGSRESLGLAAMGDGSNAWLCADAAAASAGSAAADASSAAVHDALRTRRTINSFATELPDGWEAALERAVEAATYAPNHKRTEPWRFHLLGSQSVRRVCELNAEIVASKKGEEAGAKKLKRWLAMPGWLVVTCVRSADAPSMEEAAGITREDYAACCCAVQNLCLSLHADGLGTKWTTGPVNFDPRFGEAAGLSAEEYVVGTIWFGEAAGEAPRPPPKRLALEEVLCRHA